MNRFKKKWLRTVSRAFTLVEVMLAVLIFGMAMMGAFSLLVFTARSLQSVREQDYATRIMESTMESVRNLSWTELLALQSANPSFNFDTSYPIVSLFGKVKNPYIVAHSDYQSPLSAATGTIHIGTVSSETNLRRVTVEISYVPSNARGRRITFKTTTIVSKYGLDQNRAVS